MHDTGRGEPPGSNDAPSGNDDGKKPQHCPELTEEVARTGIPVLQQEEADNALDDRIPALDQTFAMFEKTVPVLEETADTPDLPPDAGGGA